MGKILGVNLSFESIVIGYDIRSKTSPLLLNLLVDCLGLKNTISTFKLPNYNP